MEFRPVDDGIAVAGQLDVADIAAVKAAGFKSLVCNRPDSEDGAVPHDDIEAAAKAAGLEFRFIPVVSGAITHGDVSDMANALDDLPRPLLAYCRTGGRCANLYMLVRQSGR